MGDDVYLVQWAWLAVVALPEFIDVSNAGQIREELLSVINRGATALIADMTATVACDHAGADAVMRADQRAVAVGAELRLAVTAPLVPRVLSISGLDRLVSIYPSRDAAIAARPPAPVLALDAEIAAAGSDGHAPPRRAGQAGRARPGRAPLPAAGRPDGTGEGITPAAVRKLPDTVITSLFGVGLGLQAAMDQPAEVTRQGIAEALGHLDDVIREIRDTAFMSRDLVTPSDPARLDGTG